MSVATELRALLDRHFAGHLNETQRSQIEAEVMLSTVRAFYPLLKAMRGGHTTGQILQVLDQAYEGIGESDEDRGKRKGNAPDTLDLPAIPPGAISEDFRSVRQDPSR